MIAAVHASTSTGELPSGREFRNRLLLKSGLLSAVATGVIAAYLFALLRLTREQWIGFIWINLGLFPVLFIALSITHRWSWLPIVRCLDLRRSRALERGELELGFAAASNLALQMLITGGGWWVLGGLLGAGFMCLRFDTIDWRGFTTMLMAASSGGFVMCVFHYFMVKRLTEPIRNALARDIGDPGVRRGLVRRVPLSRKLFVSLTGVMLVTVAFVIQLAQMRAADPIESRANDLHRRFLAGVADALAADPAGLAAARADARRLGIADDLLLLDATGAAPAESAAVLSTGELARLRETSAASGDSRDFDSPSVFTWQRTPAGVLVAVSAWEPLRGDVTSMQIELAGLLVGAVLLTASLAWLLAQDVGRATEALRGEAERLSSGDLRRGEVYESEDELGELSRSFEAMGSSLRATVARVSEAADRVEATAGEMAGVSEAVSSVTADQVRGIQQTTTSMEEINRQVRGIADSSQRLNVSVEESSSSILELGAAGEELNETAMVLSGRVNEVSSSIEQMVRSVKQVLENTEALSEAAVETSSSMGEMATSMREVDVSAEETARLSDQVVASAESGQTKMVQTIEGMEAIREATETAERVIRNLGSRTREIGAIVDVIDDVADETNLLALNAAIIAAQAGEQGKAFSVVADEIKELADRVLASTKEIGGLIRAVQEEGSNAIGAIEKGASQRGLGGGPVGGGGREPGGDHAGQPAERDADRGDRVGGAGAGAGGRSCGGADGAGARGSGADPGGGGGAGPGQRGGAQQQRGHARGGAAGAGYDGGAGAGLGPDPRERGGGARGGGADQRRLAGAVHRLSLGGRAARGRLYPHAQQRRVRPPSGRRRQEPAPSGRSPPTGRPALQRLRQGRGRACVIPARMRRLAAALIVFAVAASACGYQLVDYARPESGARKVALPTLRNDSYEPGVELLVADALRREFLRRGAFQLTNDPAAADLVVSGSVLPIQTSSTSFSSVVLALEYQVSLSLELHAKRADGIEIPLDPRSLRETERYLASADVAALHRNREEALRRLASVLAARVHDEVFEVAAP